MKLPYAEDINYWKSGKSTPDTWLDKCENIIEQLGGTVHLRAKGKMEDREAFLMEFSFGDERFRILFPVLPQKKDDPKAAQRQAATLLYHDVKARSLRASIFGNKPAFFDFLILEDGRTVSQLNTPEINNYIPKLLTQ